MLILLNIYLYRQLLFVFHLILRELIRSKTGLHFIFKGQWRQTNGGKQGVWGGGKKASFSVHNLKLSSTYVSRRLIEQ